MGIRVKHLQEEARKKVARTRRLAERAAKKFAGKIVLDIPKIKFAKGDNLEKEMDDIRTGLKLPEEFNARILWLEKFFQNLVEMCKSDGWPAHDGIVSNLWRDIENLQSRAEAVEEELILRTVSDETAPLHLLARILVSMARLFDNSLEEFVIMARGMDFRFYVAEVNERRCIWQRGW